MRILVYPHDLGIGGSQLNAIELAGRLQGRGHEVTVFGRPGPLVARVEELGLEFVPAPAPRRRPSPRVVRALTELVQRRGFDVLHGYEWPPILEAWIAARQSGRDVRGVGTVMSMAVAPFLPRSLPLLVGTEQIAAAEELAGRRGVQVMEPPVDLEHNRVDADAVAAFRDRWRIAPDELTVLTVTRLARELKSEGLFTAVDEVTALAADRPVKLVIVGGGPAEAEVRRRVEQANARCGREVAVMTGELADPRPAYAVGDVQLAMGGSALRALCFGKPLIVQGERGFWRLLDPDSVGDFLWAGWYGVGEGVAAGPAALRGELAKVLDDPDRRRELGRFGRELVERRFGLDAATDRLEQFYADALAPTRTGVPFQDVLTSGVRFGRYSVARRAGRVLHRAHVDDFNSRPVASSGLRRQDVAR